MHVPEPILRALVHLTGFAPSRSLDRALRRPRETQQAVLSRLLTRSAGTEIGRRFKFPTLSSIRSFQEGIPILDYSALAPDIDRIAQGGRDILFPATDRLRMFGLTSGSTGKPKRIPITDRYVRRFRQTYGIWSTRILGDHPRLVEGKYLAIVSDWRESFTETGVPCGAVTGLLASLQPPWIKKRMVVSPHCAGVSDPVAKEWAVLHHALSHETVLWTAANPSTLLRLATRLEGDLEDLLRGLSDGRFPFLESLPPGYHEHPDFRPQPERARELTKRLERGSGAPTRAIWPDLQVLSCWTGGTLTPYLDSLRAKFPGVPIRDPGLMASEGRFTIPIEDGAAAGIPDLNSMFFEFYPAEGEESPPVGEPARLLLPDEIEVGKRYFLLFTTDWGLYRYHIDDIIEVDGRIGEVPLIRFVRKGSGFSSLTGEKLSEDQVVRAYESLPSSFRAKRNDLILAPVWGEPPRYLMFVERGEDLTEEETRRAAAELEKELIEMNCEYEVKRKSHRLAEIRAAWLEPGTFDRLKSEEVSAAGGRAEQYKLKRIRGDLNFAERLAPYRILNPGQSRRGGG